jgi:predicted RNA-binding Zn ribbon-like protein
MKCNERDLEEAKELRTAIRRVFDRVLEAKTLHLSDIDLLNARSNDLNRILAGSHNNYKLRFRLESASDVLALIAQTCSELLASPRLNSMRRCASEKCIFYFVDSSKNQLRHWCSMETCGNREKVRKHYDKNKARCGKT